MNNILRTAIASLALATLVSVNDAEAQRTVGARSVTLSDGTSNTLTLIAPSPATWSGNLDWEVPIPPVSGANSGFTYAGNSVDDLLAWLPATQTYGVYSGGSAGAWVPKTSAALGFISSGSAAGGDLTGTYPNPTIANSAVNSLKIADGAITNSDINVGAAIAYSKLSLAGSIVNADVSPTAAIAYSKLSLANSILSSDIADGSIMNTDVNVGAGITYGKLNLANSIVNADVAAGAAIAYSKLNLGSSILSSDIADGSIMNTDVNAGAGITYG
ncbi:MAG TPA: hypothetical protein VFH43_05055 [Candidatus Kapabacteria bacterium]|nr:hypothetical protein [Candidatus Kapabacteria bacterium]